MTRASAKRRYDRRPMAEILAGPEFAALGNLPGLSDIPPRELKSLGRFLRWAEARSLEAPSVSDLLDFMSADGAARVLNDLRLALGKVLPDDAHLRIVVQEAIRQARPRSRRCDWRSREAILQEPQLAPYRDLPGMTKVSLQDLRALDRFLVFSATRSIEVPEVRDFLDFSADTGSTRRLRSLEAALLRLLPGNPAVLLTLREAIVAKEPPKSPVPPPPRTAKHSLRLKDLPPPWQALLARLRQGDAVGEFGSLAESTVRNMEESLRAYAGTLAGAGLPVRLSITGIRLHEDALRGRGARPATLHTATLRLRQFALRIGADADIVEALRVHENTLRRALAAVVPLKEAKFAAMPELRATWRRALALLKLGNWPGDRIRRRRQRNEAFALAFWTLVPLRLQDGDLAWGREILWDGERYSIDVVTNKQDVPLRGRLHPALTPFLDALLLEGVDALYLPEMRARAFSLHLPLLRGSKGKALATDYPSTVWRNYLGTGAHISRTRIHTELGRLGPEGVEAALALCAQRDPRTKRHYQARSVAEAEMRQGQEMMDGLLEDLGKDFYT